MGKILMQVWCDTEKRRVKLKNKWAVSADIEEIVRRKIIIVQFYLFFS
jgi:hypothetical protein